MFCQDHSVILIEKTFVDLNHFLKKVPYRISNSYDLTLEKKSNGLDRVLGYKHFLFR